MGQITLSGLAPTVTVRAGGKVELRHGAAIVRAAGADTIHRFGEGGSRP